MEGTLPLEQLVHSGSTRTMVSGSRRNRQTLLYPYQLAATAALTTAAVSTTTSVVKAAGETSASEDGDYRVCSNEMICSPHSSYQVLELLGNLAAALAGRGSWGAGGRGIRVCLLWALLTFPSGRGTFGQVLKCWKRESGEVVALKILKNLPSYSKQGQMEVEVLTTLSKIDSDQFNFVHAHESFLHQGHICIAFEMLQTNLYDYLKKKRFQPLPLKHIRPIAQQVGMCVRVCVRGRGGSSRPRSYELLTN